jgi:hypothetical protein
MAARICGLDELSGHVDWATHVVSISVAEDVHSVPPISAGLWLRAFLGD